MQCTGLTAINRPLRGPESYFKTGSISVYVKKLRKALLKNELGNLSLQEMQHLVRDMRTHQIELETEMSEMLCKQRDLEMLLERYEDLFDTAPVGYFTLDGEGLIRAVNTTGAGLLRGEKSFLAGTPFASFVHPDDRAIFAEHTSSLKRGQKRQECEIRLLRKDGDVFYAWVESSVTEVDRGCGCCRTVVTDITERRRGEEQLRVWSLMDELTGLYNRRGFFTLAEQQLKMSVRSEKGLTLLSADLDNLKYINDTFGHAEGDRALIGISDILRETFRESDIIARMGGDEFVVLYGEPGDFPGDIVEKRLRENLAAMNRQATSGYEVSLSMGLSCYDPLMPCSIHELLVEADKAMYREKGSKKSACAVRA